MRRDLTIPHVDVFYNFINLIYLLYFMGLVELISASAGAIVIGSVMYYLAVNPCLRCAFCDSEPQTSERKGYSISTRVASGITGIASAGYTLGFDIFLIGLYV